MRDEPEVLEPAALDRLFRVGGHEFVIEMIDLFLEHAPQRLDAAYAAARAGDMVTVHRSAHSLKSTAANIGALSLQAVAAEVEAAASGSEVRDAGPLVERMHACFEAIKGQLEAERARREALVEPTAEDP